MLCWECFLVYVQNLRHHREKEGCQSHSLHSLLSPPTSLIFNGMYADIASSKKRLYEGIEPLELVVGDFIGHCEQCLH